MKWTFENKEFKETDIGNYIGFVYIIHNITKDKFYIGKKNFFKIIKRKPLKNKKRGRSDKVFSDWENYCGSSKELTEDIENGDVLNKTILKLCTSKASMTYYELKYQLEHDALFKDNYYNGIINVRLSKICSKNIQKDA